MHHINTSEINFQQEALGMLQQLLGFSHGIQSNEVSAVNGCAVPPGAPAGQGSSYPEANYPNTTFDTGVLCPSSSGPAHRTSTASYGHQRVAAGAVRPGGLFPAFSAILCPQAVCLEWTLSTSWLNALCRQLRRSVLFLFPLYSTYCLLMEDVYYEFYRREDYIIQILILVKHLSY